MYKKGDRVELHPAHDRWMMGDRFGTIRRLGRKRRVINTFTKKESMMQTYWVLMDKSAREFRLIEDNISLVDEW